MEPRLELEDIKWAVNVIRASNTLLRRGIKDHAPVNDFEKNINHVLQALLASPEGLTKAEVQARTRHISNKGLEDVFKKLYDMGEVSMVERRGEGRGRPTKIFFHVKYHKQHQPLQELENE